MTLQRLLRQQPSLREITENIFHHTWARGMRRRGDYGRFKDEYYQNGFQSGIINVVIPDRFENPLFAGVQDIHVHIFPTRYDGAGIRIGFGNGWRLDYEEREGRDGEIFIRSPDNNQHPHPGLSDRLSFPEVAQGIRNTLNGLALVWSGTNPVPNDLLNITDDNLRDFIEYILFHLMTQIQQHRIRGGKKKTYRKYKDKKIKTRRKNLKKTRRKNLKKTRRKNLKKTRRKNLKKTKRKNRKNNRNKKHTRTKKANGK